MLLWLTEPRQAVRWAGFAATIALLAAFGQLHGSLLGHQRLLRETGELTAPDWAAVLAPTLAALTVAVVLALVAGGVRLLGATLLVAVMAQGILGGLRVYLNALNGSDLAAIHGVFSQIVLALAVGVVVATRPRPATRWPTPRATSRCIVAASGARCSIPRSPRSSSIRPPTRG